MVPHVSAVYTVSSTDILVACDAICLHAMRGTEFAMCGTEYALCGTQTAYGAIILRAMRCAVLRQRMVLSYYVLCAMRYSDSMGRAELAAVGESPYLPTSMLCYLPTSMLCYLPTHKLYYLFELILCYR
eukprot:3940477-Rhodomonas_salina.2